MRRPFYGMIPGTRLVLSFPSIDAGASIITPNIGNSALIIEELDWGGQDALNTCENSFFGPHLGLGRQKTLSDLDKPLMWSCHIYFRKFALFILESFLYLFYKV